LEQPCPFDNGRNCKKYNSLAQETHTAKILKISAIAAKYNIGTQIAHTSILCPNRTKIYNKYSDSGCRTSCSFIHIKRYAVSSYVHS
jgi:hypothetical protein